MNKFAEVIKPVKNFNEILKAIKNNSIVINGVTGTQKRHLAFSISEVSSRPFLFVVQNDMEVEETIEDLSFFLQDKVYFFPEENLIFKNSIKSKDIYIKRAEIFQRLLNNEKPNIVITTGVLLNSFPKINSYKDSVMTFEIGKSYEIEDISKHLVDCGYERAEIVEGVGQFAIRGGILDIYSPTTANPIRIEFFDTEVDSIRIFDVMSQRTIEQCESAKVFPVATIDQDEDKFVSFLDYLTDDYLIFLEEPQRVVDKIDTTIFEYGEMLSKGSIEEEPKKIFSREEIFQELLDRKTVFLSTLETKLKGFSNAEKYFILSREISSFGNSLDNLYNSLKEWQEQKYKVILLSGTETKGKNVCKELEEKGIESEVINLSVVDGDKSIKINNIIFDGNKLDLFADVKNIDSTKINSSSIACFIPYL